MATQSDIMNNDFAVDLVVPPPVGSSLGWLLMDLPQGFQEIIMMETHGTSYLAIEHVLTESIRDQDRMKPYIHDNKTVILYDALLKIAICTTIVFHQGKFIYHIMIFIFFLFNVEILYDLLPIIAGKSKVAAKQVMDADISNRLGYSSTVVRALRDFLNKSEYADFTVAVSIGNILII